MHDDWPSGAATHDLGSLVCPTSGRKLGRGKAAGAAWRRIYIAHAPSFPARSLIPAFKEIWRLSPHRHPHIPPATPLPSISASRNFRKSRIFSAASSRLLIFDFRREFTRTKRKKGTESDFRAPCSHRCSTRNRLLNHIQSFHHHSHPSHIGRCGTLTLQPTSLSSLVTRAQAHQD